LKQQSDPSLLRIGRNFFTDHLMQAKFIHTLSLSFPANSRALQTAAPTKAIKGSVTIQTFKKKEKK
jgi:hypothetical protein